MTNQEILEKLKFDLELRNRSEDTIQDYSKHVMMFQDYFNKPADQMGVEEIRAFLHYRLTERNNSPATVNTCNSALRFLYGEALDVVLNLKKIPRIKSNRKIPDIPTKEELGYLFYLTRNLKYKAIFLFITEKGTHLTTRAVQDAFKKVVAKSGIPKHITVHTLRHCFATHCLNEGKDVFEIKRLLGHVRIDTTTWYYGKRVITGILSCRTVKRLSSPVPLIR